MSDANDCHGLQGLSAPRRNNYYYGKLLDVAHLEMEQRYVNRKRWLLNRLALGAGVLCGLRVSADAGKLTITAGAAIDAYGREIIVPESAGLDAWTVVDAEGQAVTLAANQQVDIYVCLEYRECKTDFQPALVSECEPQPRGMPGTIVESYALHVLKDRPDTGETDEKLCAAIARGRGATEKRAALCEAVGKFGCTPGDVDCCVILAVVTLDTENHTVVNVRNCAARTLLYSNKRLFDLLLCPTRTGDGGGTTPPPAETPLTTITKLSWTHDGDYAPANFPAVLTTTFSGPVTATTTTGTAWFIVTLEAPSGGGASTLTMLSSSHGGGGAASPFTMRAVFTGTVTLGASDATFAFPADLVTQIQNLPPRDAGDPETRLMCRVQVLCDFLLDARERAVDGDFLGARTPTGDGVAGGVLDSWFFLTI